MKLTRILSSLVRVTTGQDLIEYALMAAFVAVAAGAIMPSVAEDIRTIFDKISCSKRGGVLSEIVGTDGRRICELPSAPAGESSR